MKNILATMVVIFLTSAACMPRSRQDALEFTSFDSFIEALEAAANSGRRDTTNAFWSSLADSEQVPFRLGDRVAFLYRGRAQSVSWVGDFTDWQHGPPLRGRRAGQSDMWVAYETFPANARLEYRIVVDGREAILDPANPLQQWGGFGPNSVLAMPDYEFPQETIPRDDVPPGDLSPPIAIDSANLGYTVNYQVYAPTAYETLSDLPAIYVTDAHEYTDPRMGSMPIVLDNLIADGAIEPVIAVFIDPRDPQTGHNRRESELLGNPAYAAFIAQELVSLIDNAYKTDRSPDRRAILGVSYGGVNAAYCGLRYPKVFHLVAMQSPAFVDDAIYDSYRATDRLPLRIFLSTGYPWDVDARTMREILEGRGYDLMYMEVPEGHSWGQWRAQLDDLLSTSSEGGKRMKYDLVFEGGGAKGMAFVGAYEELVERGHTFGRLLGTSAGAITAAFIASGYTPAGMLAALNEREDGQPVFTQFMGPPSPFTQEEIRTSAIRKLLRDINIRILPDLLEDRVDDAIAQMLAQDPRFRHLFSLVERGGWYSADRFVTWMKAKLDSGPWNDDQREFSHMTLTQFFAETQVHLSLVAADTTDGRLLVLNHHTAPDCPLVWAVRMSMSIPLLWEEVVWDASWGQYLGETITDHTVVDGGLLSNLPIELFISDEPQVTRLMGPKQETSVLGLLIDESLPVPPLSGARDSLVDMDLVDISVKPGELRTVQRLKRLLNTATGAHDKMVIDEFDHQVVRLPAKGYGTTEFDMSDERRDALVEAGRQAMGDYFDRPSAPAAAPRDLDDMKDDHAKRIADRIATSLLGQ